VNWRIAGRYFESCNCDPICPCRMSDGAPGGRSTYGECFGVLGWLVDDGTADEVDLAGLAAALLVRYDDDEPRSPWSIVLVLDERGTEEQREVLGRILLGEAGGDHVLRLPWVRKPRHLLDVRSGPIAFEHGPDGYRLDVAQNVSLVATTPYAGQGTVRCGIPGYDQPGVELVADGFTVDAGPFNWQITGNCAFASHFDYSG
jgi:hypothetical protein